MKLYPNATKYREDLNLRQGIKSSLPEMKALIALSFVLYEVNNRKSNIAYNQENSITGVTKIKDDIKNKVARFFTLQNLNTNATTQKVNIVEEINKNPLFTAQLEALQVSLQLFLKFCTIDFVADYPATKERTGGGRYEKMLSFSTNLDLLHLVLADDEDKLSDNVKNILWNWITGETDFNENKYILDKIKYFLTILTEETKFKIRKEGGDELYFQQEGIYEILVDGNTVIEKDFHEPVGPFRIFKSFINKDLHRYIREGKAGFEGKLSQEELENHLLKVGTTLDLIPRRITIFEDNISEKPNPTTTSTNLTPKQKIYFGSPGTGKSTAMQNFADENDLKVIRTTFHPDTDYHSFVGGYKPVMKDDKITYQFVPQAFTKAYVQAYLNPDKNYLLAIEEINRGNCAQIFGDLFQCLDRNPDGYSCYPIDANADLANYLASQGLENSEELVLPHNLLIYATMNTSDQSLFPMDAAFKRRWDWQYVPIEFNGKANEIKIVFDDETQYSWRSFIENVNEKIKEITKSEDKKIGVYFVSVDDDNTISLSQFQNKVMFYLWSEIFKDEHQSADSIFKYKNSDGNETDFTFNELFESEGLIKLKGFMNYLLKPIQ
ncbi:AAA family ATPase [Arcicella sp. LKC2W]|uniref:McrB family protein n=1 Tax=Arcicella sp. LKC2W TaxID=2984198 RepID=UPI002B1E970D|nr:AAA family ATPase [Arcicella sp. LKC2W]MEA5458057.1 AAA family ATPase [Arcicella sp. LKC2W]